MVLKIARIMLYLVLMVGLLFLFVIIHELGHTFMARLLGDPDSTFYLVRIDENGTCLGCNIFDHTKISPLGILLVSLSGLASTSLAGLGLMLFSAWRRLPAVVQRWSLRTGLVYIVMDSLVQGLQGLLYNIENHTWPTNVDLMDAQLLLQDFTGFSQATLKVGLLILFVLYLTGVVLLYRRISRVNSGNRQVPETG